MRNLLFALVFASSLGAQTPPAGVPCPTQSILLAAKPIFGVGKKTIEASCPAFLSAFTSWYASHPTSTSAEIFAALNGVTIQPPPVVVPPSPPVVTPPPPPQGAGVVYSDDFSSYGSTADLLKRFWVGPSRDDGGVTPVGVTYDTVEKAMRYDWPARPNAACSGAEMTVAMMPRWVNPPRGTNEVWIKFTSKESPNFEHGRSNCGGRSYKFFLVGFNNAHVGARVGTYLFDGTQRSAADPAISTRLYVDGIGAQGGLQIGGDQGWGGQYRTWTLGVQHIGTDSATFSTYLNDALGVPRLVHTLKGPFLKGQTLGPGWAITFEMGANINNGPDHAQSRWFKEFGVYTSKAAAGVPQ